MTKLGLSDHPQPAGPRSLIRPQPVRDLVQRRWTWLVVADLTYVVDLGGVRPTWPCHRRLRSQDHRLAGRFPRPPWGPRRDRASHLDRPTRRRTRPEKTLSTARIGDLSTHRSGSASGSPRQASTVGQAVGSSYDNALAETISIQDRADQTRRPRRSIRMSSWPPRAGSTVQPSPPLPGTAATRRSDSRCYTPQRRDQRRRVSRSSRTHRGRFT